MILYHTTHKRNLASILKHGLDPARSQGKRRAVWIHVREMTHWALSHCCLRHKWNIFALVRIKVRVPKAWVKRHNDKLFYCLRTIPARFLGRVEGLAELAKSPVKGG